MTDTEKLLVILGSLLSLGSLVVGTLIAWGIQKSIGALFSTVVEVKLLRAELVDIKMNHSKIPKLEKDLNELHSKIREFTRESRDS
jgi:hypothetical protein